ncbi:acyl carrier protein [compost metagenome]
MRRDNNYLYEINELVKELTESDLDIILEDHLSNDLLLSSLDIVHLIVMIEKKYNIIIDMDVLFTTVGDIVEFINKECEQHV